MFQHLCSRSYYITNSLCFSDIFIKSTPLPFIYAKGFFRHIWKVGGYGCIFWIMPKRIQFRRVKGFRLPPGCVRVTRPSKFGNQFKIAEGRTRQDCISAYEIWLTVLATDEFRAMVKTELRGKDLACFCRTDQECHADILLKFANN